MKIKTLFASAIMLSVAACGQSTTDAKPTSETSSTSNPATNNSTQSPQQTMQDGLATVADNIAANSAGELRVIKEPLFDDFEFGITHGITMHNPMKMVNATIDIYDLELFEKDPQQAFSGLVKRLQVAGFTQVEHEKDDRREKWKFRRDAEGKGNAAIFVSFSLRPFRPGASKTYPDATTKATLEVSDSRPKQ